MGRSTVRRVVRRRPPAGRQHAADDVAGEAARGQEARLPRAFAWVLRQCRPEAALPFENTALNFIKQVQQATRIYLPRIGSQQPPIDMTRRLTGKREGIVGGGAQLTPFAIEDAVPATACQFWVGTRVALA